MAVSRYDQRKNYKEAEANAIGTEYARADLLPVDDGVKLRESPRKYVNQRDSCDCPSRVRYERCSELTRIYSGRVVEPHPGRSMDTDGIDCNCL